MSERITLDKPYDLKGDVSPRMVSNIDEMLGILFWSVAQLENKLSDNQGLLTSQNTSITEEAKKAATNINLTQWKKGPWTLDEIDVGDTFNATGIAVINNNYSSGTTLNNYDPPGLETAVALELGGVGSTGITLTGIRQHTPVRRVLGVINRDTSTTITLVHESSSSSPNNRFDMPNDVNVVLAAGQAMWLYYSIYRDRWIPFITPHSSGGLATMTNGYNVADITLTEAAIESANSGIELVAATAGKVILPLRLVAYMNITDDYTNNPAWSLRYNNGASPSISSAPNFSMTATGSKYVIFDQTSVALGFDPTNLNMTLWANANPTGVGAATGTAVLSYALVDGF